MRSAERALRWLCGLLALLACTSAVRAEELPEYRLKAAFLYNFALFTEWPAEVGATLNLCIRGPDPFGAEIDALRGKAVGGRRIDVQRKTNGESLADCQMVFITATAIEALPRILDSVRGKPVLTVADTPGAVHRGAMLNMNVSQNRVSFEANLQAAKAARLVLSSKLLRLATEVVQ